MPVIIAGYSSNDRVPGAYGEVLYGTGGQNAASAPLITLLVGAKGAAGTLTPDTEVRQVFSKADIDIAAAAGSELACMAYDAIDTAPNSPLFLAAPTIGGGVAGTLTATVGGSWSTPGQITFRVAGKPVVVTILATDTTTTAATAIGVAISGAYNGRLPCSALGAAAICTFTSRTLNIRANQNIIFCDLSQAPSGLTCVLAGGTAVTGGGVPLSSGAGLETYTAILSTLSTSQYDTIAFAANDSVSIAAIKTQIDAQAAAPTNILQHAVICSNGTNGAAVSLAQTTLNDQRFSWIWYLNGESHPSRVAAAVAALRSSTEQQDPCAAYNNQVLPTVAPMSQKADWPSHAVLVSSINNSLSPIFSTGDGYARLARSITTKSLTGGNPDYSTLDTGQARVPDFILKDLKLEWTTRFAIANPRVQDNPVAGQRIPASGVAYPDLWASVVHSKMLDYAQGILSGTSKSVAPIVINVTPPVGSFDSVGRRIMIANTVIPAYNNASVGISVRQAA